MQAYHLSTAKKLLQQASDGDIVVSDLRLPDGDGKELEERARVIANQTLKEALKGDRKSVV